MEFFLVALLFSWTAGELHRYIESEVSQVEDLPRNCEFSFKKMRLEEIETKINKSYCSVVNLTIIEGRTPEQIFRPMWLSATVEELEILDSDLKSLNNFFNADTFRDMKMLKISVTSIMSLTKDSFIGLNQLKSLKINLTQLKTLEEEAFEPFKETLEIYEVSGTSLDLQSLLNPVKSTNVQYMSFYFNNFGDQLQSESFSTLKSLKTLNLTSNEITYLPFGLFKGISSTLESVDLSKNRLESLPDGIFSPFPATAPKIYLADNLWICNCSLLELQSLMNAQSSKGWFVGQVRCFGPEEVKFLAVNISPIKCEEEDRLDSDNECSYPFCLGNRNRNIYGIDGSGYETITCEETAQSLILYGTNYNEIQLKKQVTNYTIVKTENGDVEVKLKSLVPSHVLLWFDQEQPEDSLQAAAPQLDCMYDLDFKTKISGLRDTSVYIFCLMDLNETTVSPFDCQSFDMRPQEEEPDIWISEDDKYLFISLWILILLVFLLIGALTVYLVLRRWPILLKGNQRIVVINERQVMVMPKGYVDASDSLNRADSVKEDPMPEKDKGDPYMRPLSMEEEEFRWSTNTKLTDADYNQSMAGYIRTVANDSTLVMAGYGTNLPERVSRTSSGYRSEKEEDFEPVLDHTYDYPTRASFEKEKY